MSKKRAHLTPTPITNKNGVPTTVYKKPAHSVTATTMPAPALPKNLNQTRQEVAARIQEVFEQTHDNKLDHSNYLRKTLLGYSEATIHELDRSLNDPTLAAGITRQIINTEPEDFIMDTIHYHRRTNSTDYSQTESELWSLQHYDEFNFYDSLSTVDEHIQQQCIALMTFPRLIDTLPKEPSPFLDYPPSQDNCVKVIDDPDLVDLIANHPDQVQNIADIVLKYKTSNTATIYGILQGEQPPLAEGHL